MISAHVALETVTAQDICLKTCENPPSLQSSRSQTQLMQPLTDHFLPRCSSLLGIGWHTTSLEKGLGCVLGNTHLGRKNIVKFPTCIISCCDSSSNIHTDVSYGLFYKFHTFLSIAVKNIKKKTFENKVHAMEDLVQCNCNSCFPTTHKLHKLPSAVPLTNQSQVVDLGRILYSKGMMM